MPVDPKRVQAIFLAAIPFDDPTARNAVLDRECAGNVDLRQRVEALLKAHDLSHAELDQPIVQPGATMDFDPQAATEKPGSMVGPFRLREQIGEGGFGLVFVADQTEPVRRRVALKLIKPGMDSKQVIARFEAERQALALMDHPHIAKVLDAGTTSTGRPFFVMELVRGIPITEYCDQNHLSPKQRLELFITVCQAIEHAHQKGIIHRDIKPSNVLVTSHDGKPIAKVIDFGVAKAIHQQLSSHTIYTNFAQMIGTPLYMSPEQAEMSGLDIDTRSDIYSLGVLLYELLTGSTPLERKRMAQAAYDEIRRLIREEEPQKPSTRLSTSDAIASIAAQRHVEPARLSKLVRGDLDWITMKALEKDRTRRYETANGLAKDIQRYLDEEPVDACPPSTRYRLRKFALKNRIALTTATAFVMLLVAGAGVSIWQAVRATRAQHIAVEAQRHAMEAQRQETERAEGERLAMLKAVEAQQSAEAAAVKEKAANEQAQMRLVQIEKGYEIIASIFCDLDIRQAKEGTEPLEAVLAKRLIKAAEELEGESVGDSLTVANLQSYLAQSLLNLGYPNEAAGLAAKAVATFKEELGADHHETLYSMNDLALAYQAAGKLDLALPLFEETLQLKKAKLGAEHEETVTSMNNLAIAYQDAGKLDLSLTLLEETLQLSKAVRGTEHKGTLAIMSNIGRTYWKAGKPELAVPIMEECLKLMKASLGRNHFDTLTCMMNLAENYRAAGKLDLALPLAEQTQKLMQAKLGAEHPATLTNMNNLASAYLATGKSDLAVPLLEESLKLFKTRLGGDHPDTLASTNNLASAYLATGKPELVVPLLEESLKLFKTRLGAEHQETAKSMNNLALAYKAIGKLELALPLFKEIMQLKKAKLGAEHHETGTSMHNLALGYQAAGKLDLAVPLFEESLELYKAALGAEHRFTLTCILNLASAYQAAGKLDLALPLLEETLQLCKATPGPDHSGTLKIMNKLIWAYYAADRLADAAGIAKEHLAIARQNVPAAGPSLETYLAQTGLILLKAKAYDEAELLCRECLAIREKAMPDSWLTFNTQSLLGAALLGQKKFAQAEPLLLSGYEGMKGREETIPAGGKIRLEEALERVVELYTAIEQPAKVQKWKAELDRRKSENQSPQPDSANASPPDDKQSDDNEAKDDGN